VYAAEERPHMLPLREGTFDVPTWCRASLSSVIHDVEMPE
jgi:hypothetical protein